MHTRTSVPALADQANILPEVVVYMLGPVYDVCVFMEGIQITNEGIFRTSRFVAEVPDL